MRRMCCLNFAARVKMHFKLLADFGFLLLELNALLRYIQMFTFIPVKRVVIFGKTLFFVTLFSQEDLYFQISYFA